jgi:excisionase family DNA binding protein
MSTPATVRTASEWIGVKDLAHELGVPVRTIYTWRTKGKGPRGATFGKHVRFRRVDVDRWIETKFDDPHAA